MALVNTRQTSERDRQTVFVVDSFGTADATDFTIDHIKGADFQLDGTTGAECLRAGDYELEIDTPINFGAASATGFTIQVDGVTERSFAVDNANGTTRSYGIQLLLPLTLAVNEIVTIRNTSGGSASHSVFRVNFHRV
jgi:hypothetical protein